MARRHLEAVTAAAAAIKKAEARLLAAMVAAHESGETFRDIGKAAGLSHQRVWQRVSAEQEKHDEPG